MDEADLKVEEQEVDVGNPPAAEIEDVAVGAAAIEDIHVAVGNPPPTGKRSAVTEELDLGVGYPPTKRVAIKELETKVTSECPVVAIKELETKVTSECPVVALGEASTPHKECETEDIGSRCPSVALDIAAGYPPTKLVKELETKVTSECPIVALGETSMPHEECETEDIGSRCPSVASTQKGPDSVKEMEASQICSPREDNHPDCEEMALQVVPSSPLQQDLHDNHLELDEIICLGYAAPGSDVLKPLDIPSIPRSLECSPTSCVCLDDDEVDVDLTIDSDDDVI